MSWMAFRNSGARDMRARYEDIASEYWELQHIEITEQEQRFLDAANKLNELKDQWSGMFIESEDKVADLINKLEPNLDKLLEQDEQLDRQLHNLLALQQTYDEFKDEIRKESSYLPNTQGKSFSRTRF